MCLAAQILAEKIGIGQGVSNRSLTLLLPHIEIRPYEDRNTLIEHSATLLKNFRYAPGSHSVTISTVWLKVIVGKTLAEVSLHLVG